MRVRRLVSIVPVLVLWAGCAGSTPDQAPEGSLFVPGDDRSIELAEELSMDVLAARPDLAGNAGDLVLRHVVIDELGEAHTRLRQHIDGIPVFGAEAIVHLKADGSFGWMTDLLVRDIVVDTTAVYLQHEAVDIATAVVGGAHRLTAEPETDLQILRHEGADHLTYRVQLEALTDDDEPSMPVLFIDAHTADLVWSYDNLQTAKNRKTYDGKKKQTLPGTLTRSEGQAPVSDAIVNQAHDNAGITYDFYFSRYGRDSYNGAGAQLTSTVHHKINYVNAFWNGTQMVYGDGDNSLSTALTVLDIVGHELTHAVTSSSSALIYANESGALNEAMSDIFGAAIEAARDGAVSANTWKIGEECWTPGTAGDALRYMNDPALANDYDYYPTRYTGTSDNGGVHWNSGIANLAFYLMVSGGSHPRGKTSTVVTALDTGNSYNSITRGAAIFYRANTTCLGPSSTFADARGCTTQAASTLYGSAAAASVTAAWDAVGVPYPLTWLTLDSKSNLSGSSGSTVHYSYPTPAGTTRMRFVTSGGSGDVDLYVKFGSAPTTSSYDCRPYKAGNAESCIFDPSQNGTYYVMLRGYSSYSGVNFTVSHTQ